MSKLLRYMFGVQACSQPRRSSITILQILSNTMMFYQMSPQNACLSRCIVTLVAFIWLFSTVRFQMYPQNMCMGSCKVTLVAFVWLFSAVCFQMSPQSTCIWWCIVTLVAFVWLFSSVDFQMCPQSAYARGCIVTLVAYVWLFSIVCFCSRYWISFIVLALLVNILIHHQHKNVLSLA